MRVPPVTPTLCHTIYSVFRSVHSDYHRMEVSAGRRRRAESAWVVVGKDPFVFPCRWSTRANTRGMFRAADRTEMCRPMDG
jgi:hypothetical protein